MQLRSFSDIEAFYQQAEPFLVAREAEHCLPLGVSARLRLHPEHTPNPYLAVVEDQGQVVGVVLRTPPYNLLLSLQDAPDAAQHIAEELHASGHVLPGVVGPSEVSRAFAQAWSALRGHPGRRGMHMRVYRLEQVRPPARAAGSMRAATVADRELLIEWLGAFHTEAMGHMERAAVERSVDHFLSADQRGLVLWLDPEPVSMAGFSGPTPHGIRIVAVYTPPELRGRGYASACVAQLSQQLLDQGRRFCFLFTDLTNPTSNKIYQNIGYEPVCDYEDYKFEG